MPNKRLSEKNDVLVYDILQKLADKLQYAPQLISEAAQTKVTRVTYTYLMLCLLQNCATDDLLIQRPQAKGEVMAALWPRSSMMA